MKSIRLLLLVSALLDVGVSVGAQVQAPARRYVVQDLPSISSFSARAFDLNNRGVAVGHALSSSLQQHALSWPGVGVVDLSPANALAEAQGISESGIVAGWAQNTAGRTEAVRWTSGQIAFLGMLPGHIGSCAQDVNDQGLVAGWSITSAGDPTAAVWSNGQIQAIGGAHSWAFAVSETGAVVGRRWLGVDIQAFRWRNQVLIVLPDLGLPYASAVGISPGGRIAGSALSPADQRLHAVLWADDLAMTDLGLFFGLSTAALDVNDAGTAVGNVLDAQGDVILAAVWRGSGAEDLNALIQPGSGWFLKEAQAINERGEIVGFGTRNGMPAPRAYLLRPDCDGDGISDLDEIAAGTADDSNHDGVADECQYCQTDLGFAGPGAMGLRVCGDPLTLHGSSATVALTQVPGGMPVFLVVGLVQQPTPIAGGILVPVPPLLILSGFVAAPDGSIRFPLHGSAALPQAIFVQAVALVGPLVQFSNALRVVIGVQ